MTTLTYFVCATLILLEIIFVPIYLKKMWPTKNWHSLGIKMVCATLYLLLATVAVKTNGGFNRFSLMMVIGFAASWFGDLMLHIPKPTKAYFGAGMVFFMIAHILYCLGYIDIQRRLFPETQAITHWEIIIAVLIIAICFAVLLIKKISFGSMIVPCIIYSAFVTTMMIKSSVLGTKLLAGGNPTTVLPAILLLIGGISFFLSDGSLALISFDTRYKKFKLKVFNSVTYFGAQVCLALTLFYFT